MERKILRTVSEVEQWFSTCTKNISFDTETTDLRYDKLELLGISIYDSKRVCYINLSNNPEREAITSVCISFFAKLSGLIGHNLSFDLMVLSKYSIPWEHCKLFDTMTAFHLIDEEGEKGLKKLANRYLDVSEPVLYEDAAKKGFDSEFFCNYAMNDALYTGQLYILFKRQLIELELDNLMKLEMEFLPCVVEMQINGFGVDLKRVEEIKVLLEKKVFDLQVEMCELLGERYTLTQDLIGGMQIETKTNFNSGKQLAVILYDRLKLPIPSTTPGGAPETGRKALEALKGKHPFVDKLALYKKCQKLISAFVEPLPDLVDSDGRVRARFNVCGTVTGRLSCDSPNLQQLPKENKELGINVRDVFTASPGYTMITCDYSGQELRVAANLTNDQTLVDSFNNGKDIHLATANVVFSLGIPDEALVESHPDFETYKKKFKDERGKAKTIGFGTLYGKGPKGFAEDFGVSEKEGQDLIDRYLAGMPSVKKAIEQTSMEVKTQGFVRTGFGRIRHFAKVARDGNEFYTREMFRQAFNFKIQSFSADMMRQGIVAVVRDRPEAWDLRMLATVHDEAVTEVKTEYLQEAMKYMKDKMQSATKLCVEAVAEVGHGDNYGSAK